VALITQLLHDSHFLFVPSRAEAFGIVFCEANAYGLPCLTSYVGGISTIVKDNINGMTFALDAPVARYCDYILDLMRDYSRYEALALSSFNEYQTRLNWNSAVLHVKNLIQEKL
jgi:glycosyltransferase involved in cell wall biosynthesis